MTGVSPDVTLALGHDECVTGLDPFAGKVLADLLHSTLWFNVLVQTSLKTAI